jgi:hypothetical protein
LPKQASKQNIINFLDHELAHVANKFIKRVDKNNKEYDLAARDINVGVFMADSDINKLSKWLSYYTNAGEVDAIAREAVELYKRRYPVKKFTIKELEALNLPHVVKLLFLSRLDLSRATGFEDLIREFNGFIANFDDQTVQKLAEIAKSRVKYKDFFNLAIEAKKAGRLFLHKVATELY